MDIIFINVPYLKVYSLIKRAFGKYPPLNLASLAAYLRERGHTTKIIDTVAEEIDLQNLEKRLRKERFDVIGVGSMTPSLIESFEVLKIAKMINPECITVMGGPHVSALPKETMESCPYLDYGVIGEGELTSAELLEKIESEKEIEEIKGIIYRKRGNIIIGQKRNNISDLDSLPFPAYDLLPIEKYSKKVHHTWSKERIALSPYLAISTSRGCIHDCAFCASKAIWGREVRYRSPESIINEIDYLVRGFGIRSLHICDETFLGNKPRVHKILDMLIEKKYELNFSFMARVDEIDFDIVKKLKRAQCHLVRFGVESCSQKVLNLMQKNITLKQIKEAFEIMRAVGICATAYIIIGYPGESKETFNETMNMLLKVVRPDAADFFIATPIVGTRLFEIAKNRGFITSNDWRLYSTITEKPVLKTESLSPQDLIWMRKKAYIRFYLRPKYIILVLRNIWDFNLFKLYIKGFFAFLNILRK